MMSAHAVIGANYGDEGKGLITDYIGAQGGADVVVRFNGGAQAGHTVTLPGGARRHVFHHLGAGTFVGLPTFLSKFFVTNPILFAKERDLAATTKVYVDPMGLVTTPFDMLINQALSRGKGDSCGVGINETMRRSWQEPYVLRVADMLSRDRVAKILRDYVPARIKEAGIDLVIEDYWLDVFHAEAEKFLSHVTVTGTPPGRNLLFEGAQGLLLDQNAPGYPHVTHSNTGIKNVLALCRDFGVPNVSATYVSRSYITRHGAGPLPHEEPMPDFVVDPTNVPHPFQGTMRYAPLDVLDLERRVIKDAAEVPFGLAITCLDQYGGPAMLGRFTLNVAYAAYGPTRDDVQDLRFKRKRERV